MNREFSMLQSVLILVNSWWTWNWHLHNCFVHTTFIQFHVLFSGDSLFLFVRIVKTIIIIVNVLDFNFLWGLLDWRLLSRLRKFWEFTWLLNTFGFLILLKEVIIGLHCGFFISRICWDAIWKVWVIGVFFNLCVLWLALNWKFGTSVLCLCWGWRRGV